MAITYNRTNWRAEREGGTAWTPERLNNIENGIEQATNQINQNSEAIDKLDESVDTLNTDLSEKQGKAWTFHSEVTGNTPITLPSEFNELIIEVESSSSVVFSFGLCSRQLVSAAKNYRGSYAYSTTDITAYLVEASASQIKLANVWKNQSSVISTCKLRVYWR